MKLRGIPERGIFELVAPRAGAWIETVPHDDMV